MPDSAFPYTPAQPLSVLQEIWKQLDAAPTNRDHPWRLLSLSTWDGQFPQTRTVVLRQSQSSKNQLTIFSDLRAQKIWQIKEHPEVTLLFYDPKLQIQVRIQGHATILEDQNSIDAIWNPLPPAARKMYLAPMKPGTPISEPLPNLPPEIVNRDPTLAESQNGRQNFGVILVSALLVDWLYLKVDGHIRAKFNLKDGKWQGSWIAT